MAYFQGQTVSFRVPATSSKAGVCGFSVQGWSCKLEWFAAIIFIIPAYQQPSQRSLFTIQKKKRQKSNATFFAKKLFKSNEPLYSNKKWGQPSMPAARRRIWPSKTNKKPTKSLDLNNKPRFKKKTSPNAYSGCAIVTIIWTTEFLRLHPVGVAMTRQGRNFFHVDGKKWVQRSLGIYQM